MKLTSPSSGRNPRGPICKRSDADAPKPPTYPFILSVFKEQRHKNHRTANPLARPAALHPNIPRLPSNRQQLSPPPAFRPSHRASVPPHSASSASVSRYLRPDNATRKRKKAKHHIFFLFPTFPTKSCSYPPKDHHKSTAAKLHCTTKPRIMRFVTGGGPGGPAAPPEAPEPAPDRSGFRPSRPCQSA